MTRKSALFYLLAAALTVVFVQGFDPWQALLALLGQNKANFVPFAAVLMAGGALLALRPQLSTGGRGQWPALLAALALAAAGLALTDPAFPGKRIHVAEYLILALVVRRAASDHAQGWALTLITAMLTTLLGVHDELLQGLHPNRSFGLMDMATDALGAGAGALGGHALNLFSRSGAKRGPALRPAAWMMAALALTFALAAMLAGLWQGGASLPGGLTAPPPLWLAAPLIGALGASALLDPPKNRASRHCWLMVRLLVLPMPLYPLVPHVVPLAFR